MADFAAFPAVEGVAIRGQWEREELRQGEEMQRQARDW